MNIFSNCLFGCMFLLCQLFQTSVAAETPASVESFFSNEGVSFASISPSGEHIAIVQTQKNKESVIAIIDTLDPTKIKVVAGETGDPRISGLGWVNDKRIYYGVSDPDGRRVMAAVDIDGAEPKTLDWFRHDSSTRSRFWGPMHDGSNNIIAETMSFKSSTGSLLSTRLYKLDTLSQRDTDWETRNLPKHVTNWLLDRHDTPRIGESKIEDKCTSWYLPEKSEAWVQIDQHNCFEEGGLAPFFLESEQNLYVTRSVGGYSKLYTYDLMNHAVADQPLIDFKGFDFNVLPPTEN